MIARLRATSKAGTLVERFDGLARRHPRQPALTHGDASVDYAELRRRSELAAAGIARSVVRPGQRVALWLPAGPDLISAMLGAWRVGAAVVLLPPDSTAGELERAVADSEPVLIVAPSGRRGPVRTALGHMPGRVAVIGQGELSRLGHGAPLRSRAPADADPAMVFCTTGTSGPAKSVVHTHRSLLASIDALERLRRQWAGRSIKRTWRTLGAAWAHRRRLLRLRGRQTWSTPMSLYTIAGFRVLLQALLCGHRYVILPRFHPVRVLETVAHERINVLAASPTMIAAMLSVRELERHDLSSLAVVGVGAAPVPRGLVARAAGAFGCPVVVGYGTTELGGGVLTTTLGDASEPDHGCVGRPLPGVEFRVVDEQHEEVAAGEVGELAFRSASRMEGYARPPEDGGALDAQGWFYTGDLGVRDALGRVRVVGRKSDVIIRGGLNLHPSEVESVLEGHPGVQRAGVVGVPSELLGEAVWAFVVPTARTRLTPAELLERCRGRISAHAIPDQVRVVDKLPLARSGEVRRPELRRWARRWTEPARRTGTR